MVYAINYTSLSSESSHRYHVNKWTLLCSNRSTKTGCGPDVPPGCSLLSSALDPTASPTQRLALAIFLSYIGTLFSFYGTIPISIHVYCCFSNLKNHCWTLIPISLLPFTSKSSKKRAISFGFFFSPLSIFPRAHSDRLWLHHSTEVTLVKVTSDLYVIKCNGSFLVFILGSIWPYCWSLNSSLKYFLHLTSNDTHYLIASSLASFSDTFLSQSLHVVV